MHRRFSTLVKGQASTSTLTDEKSETSTVQQDVQLPVPKLKVKRVDYYYSRWTKQWKYRNMSSSVTVETRPVMKLGDSDPWKDFCFVVVRTVPIQQQMDLKGPTFKFVIKSEYLLKALKDVIRSWPGISWNSNPVEVAPEILLTYMPDFTAYRNNILSNKQATEEERYTASTVSVLLDTLADDYRATLATIADLTAHGEITFELLYAIFVPRSIIIAECNVTGELRGFELVCWNKVKISGKEVLQLTLESVDIVDTPQNTAQVGRVRTIANLVEFQGAMKISDLDAYPIKYHPRAAEVEHRLRERGRKWANLTGIHHVQYKGIAAIKTARCIIRHNVNGRIMVDRATFKRLNPNYIYPIVAVAPNAEQEYDEYDNPTIPIIAPTADANTDAIRTTRPVADMVVEEKDLVLTTPTLYGFSLGDKVWMEFNVEHISPVEWNSSAFTNLVLPPERKELLQTLVEAHHRDLGFDDFIKGKGHGLVINLFGNPGVGKTFSAEATSEHVKRPLYVIGAGDLGTDATAVDQNLERVFDVATAWKAIVLIDEADVFLEQRSLHDLTRNAAVAVFLRHIEYYRGILFLTTNRVRAFDEAFLSRIHVALHFNELDQMSKEQVWAAFLNKIGASQISKDDIRLLASRNVNGRQIKNAVKTAQSLAAGRGETLGLAHFAQTLDAMEEFTKEFESMKLE